MNSRFDERAFRSQVFSEYLFLRKLEESTKGVTENPDRSPKEIAKKHGCLSGLFMPAINKMARLAADKTYEQKQVNEDRGGAKELLDRKEIKDRLCPRLTELPGQSLLPEELEIKIIRILVEELASETEIEEPLLERNPSKFAQLAMEVLDRGIENCCASRQN
ncbi:MAG: hypothetical protein IPM63_12790 [Acidobacteriota bacterium]|nr:MAG: hypothetical protein IPM63_12790 [Acidobacteriota bacterium]